MNCRYQIPLLLGFTAIWLSACRPTQLIDWFAPPIEIPPPTELQLAVWSNGSVADELLQTIVDAYETENRARSSGVAGTAQSNNDTLAEVEVDLRIVPQYTRSLLTLLRSDEPPDIFLVDTFGLPALVDAALLLPLREGGDSLFQSTVLDDIYPELQEAFSVGETLYCMPREFSTLALIYNEALFNDASIAHPQAPWGWDEFQGNAQTITEATNDFYSTFGLALNADVSRWLPFLIQAGGTVVDRDNNVMTIDSPEGLRAMEFYLGLITEGHAVEPSNLSSGWGGEVLGTGRVGMIIEGSWIIPYLEDEFPSLNYGVTELPRGPKGTATALFGNCYAIHANSPNRDEAIRFLRYLTSADGMTQWQTVSTYLPARLSLEGATLTSTPALAPFYNGLSYATPWQFPPGFEALIDAVNGSMQQVIDAEIDAQEVLRVGRVVGTDLLEE